MKKIWLPIVFVACLPMIVCANNDFINFQQNPVVQTWMLMTNQSKKAVKRFFERQGYNTSLLKVITFMQTHQHELYQAALQNQTYQEFKATQTQSKPNPHAQPYAPSQNNFGSIRK